LNILKYSQFLISMQYVGYTHLNALEKFIKITLKFKPIFYLDWICNISQTKKRCLGFEPVALQKLLELWSLTILLSSIFSVRTFITIYILTI